MKLSLIRMESLCMRHRRGNNKTSGNSVDGGLRSEAGTDTKGEMSIKET